MAGARVLAEYRFEVVVEGVHVDTVQPDGDAETGQNPLDIVAAQLIQAEGLAERLVHGPADEAVQR